MASISCSARRRNSICASRTRTFPDRTEGILKRPTLALRRRKEDSISNMLKNSPQYLMVHLKSPMIKMQMKKGHVALQMTGSTFYEFPSFEFQDCRSWVPSLTSRGELNPRHSLRPK